MLFNGAACDHALAQSRGLHYGDGVFRTMLLWQGAVVDLRRQLDVLERDAAGLGLLSPPRATLEEEIAALCADEELGVIKLILTRRAGGRGYRAADDDCDRLLLRLPVPRYPAACWERGVRCFLSPVRLADQPLLAGIKHLNRLEQVLASRDWPGDAEEGFVCDARGLVVCGTRSNLFRVAGGRLVTPALERCGIRGMMREKILELAERLQMPVHFDDTDATQLRQADEIFVCNSLIGIWPVREFDGAALQAPGPLTQRLMAALDHPRLG
ncbi:aminodeoxychorismate lyase [Solimonas sp. K1W22B-7]|uniref:aminodeoxychorismate lyase n=1 Tax=Solimonas sp. K1W22B-7 TaxID=2303331 RepID=UPI001F09546A|nr:aminodeoxychorismate lyase [Solimonas sp. K1W22B-7]